MKEIQLTQGFKAKVDDRLFFELDGYDWHVNILSTSKYASRTGKGIKMHWDIWNMKNGVIPKGKFIDHIDGDGLNNQINNLRLASQQENCRNKRKFVSTASQYKGIFLKEYIGENGITYSWYAVITYNGKSHHIGSYSSEIEAAHVYDSKAKELFGEFARLNFP